MDLSPSTHAPRWLDHLEMNPGPPTHRMGVRRLDLANWLDVDELRPAELAHKEHLVATMPESVLAWLDDLDGHAVVEDAQELLVAIVDHLATHHDIATDITTNNTTNSPTGVGDRHPLDTAGRLVQEDLALLRTRDDGTTILTGGSVCFPSGWFLQEKLGKPLTDIHQPIPQYEQELAHRVDTYFARITPDRPGWRRNWFVYDNPALFQPEDPVATDPARRRFFIRSERQTMRRLPRTGALVFTIRTQQCTLSALAERPDVAAQMATYFRSAPPTALATKGVGRYAVDLLNELDQLSRTNPPTSTP